MKSRYRVIQRSPHEELEGEIVGSLGCFARVGQLSVVPVELNAIN